MINIIKRGGFSVKHLKYMKKYEENKYIDIYEKNTFDIFFINIKCMVTIPYI